MITEKDKQDYKEMVEWCLSRCTKQQAVHLQAIAIAHGAFMGYLKEHSDICVEELIEYCFQH